MASNSNTQCHYQKGDRTLMLFNYQPLWKLVKIQLRFSLPRPQEVSQMVNFKRLNYI